MTTDIIMTTNETKKTELVVITPKVQEYVCAWHVATKKTITAIFDQSTLLAKAKNELSATDYKSFLKEAQVTNSTAKKTCLCREYQLLHLVPFTKRIHL